jgi:hypothetical protein
MALKIERPRRIAGLFFLLAKRGLERRLRKDVIDLESQPRNRCRALQHLQPPRLEQRTVAQSARELPRTTIDDALGEILLVTDVFVGR